MLCAGSPRFALSGLRANTFHTGSGLLRKQRMLLMTGKVGMDKTQVGDFANDLQKQKGRPFRIALFGARKTGAFVW